MWVAALAASGLSLLLLVASQAQVTLTTDSPDQAGATTAASAPYVSILGPQNLSSYSPPYYPTPQARGEGAWKVAIARARAYLAASNFTLEERVTLATGVGWQNGRCVGNTPSIDRVGWKGLCLEDSPLGVRDTDGVSAFPAGINVAATFDKDLAYRRGYAMVSVVTV